MDERERSVIRLATRVRGIQRESVQRWQVTKYIASQQEHHKKVRFEDEFISLLKKHEMEYDERYVWG